MGPLNDLGLLKMDFLGLKTLTVIEDTLVLIRKREPAFSLKNIPLNDVASFGLYNRGETIGLFQMESGGMTNLSKQFEVKKTKAKKRNNYIEGCARTNKIAGKKANAIFDLLEKFAGYGFNKSHSAAYGVISYQTAYLKSHYPVEFMAGLLSNEINNTDKISVFVGECKRMGISILPPDINRSGLKFTPEPHDGGMAIRYGLAAIKNVGEAAMEVSIQERER